jgi:hypothetical protein
MTAVQHVRVEGTAYQRGRQYGTQAAERVRHSVRAYERVFAHLTRWDWAAVLREAARFESPVGDFRAGYLEEMRGIADGAGLGVADILAINVRTEVMYSAKARQAPLARPPAGRPPIAECSAFARAPAPGQPGGPVLGQNWDWLTHAAQTLIVLEARPDDGPDFVTVVEAGLLLHTNHLQAPRAGPADLGLWAMPSSEVRLQRLRAGAGKRDLDGFGALLADHADHPHSICAHPDPADHPLDAGARPTRPRWPRGWTRCGSRAWTRSPTRPPATRARCAPTWPATTPCAPVTCTPP